MILVLTRRPVDMGVLPVNMGRVAWSCSRLVQQEGLAVASIARDDPSTLPGDDPSPLPGVHRDHNAR